MPNSALLERYASELFVMEMPYAILKLENSYGLTYEAIKVSEELLKKNLFKVPNGYKDDKKLFKKVD